MKKKILFVFRHAPYGSLTAREGLEALLAASVYEQDISVLFINDGVFQLIDAHQPMTGIKNHSKMLSVLPMYDIDKLYVNRASLVERGLAKQILSLNVHPIDNIETHQLISTHEAILSF